MFSLGVEKALTVLSLLGKDRVLASRAMAMRDQKLVSIEESGLLYGGKFRITLEFDGRQRSHGPDPRWLRLLEMAKKDVDSGARYVELHAAIDAVEAMLKGE